MYRARKVCLDMPKFTDQVRLEISIHLSVDFSLYIFQYLRYMQTTIALGSTQTLAPLSPQPSLPIAAATGHPCRPPPLHAPLCRSPLLLCTVVAAFVLLCRHMSVKPRNHPLHGPSSIFSLPAARTLVSTAAQPYGVKKEGPIDKDEGPN